jgi:hypothetical protein
MIMKRYCLGLFLIVLIAITAVPAFYHYAMNNMADTDIFIRPGWMYGLALFTAILAAYLCERSPSRHQKKI